MKLIFAGTPEFAVPSLKALIGAGFTPVAVLTQPDRPQGRKGVLTPSPVKCEALASEIRVLQPEKLKEDFASLKELEAELMVTCAYGQILTRQILELFPLGVWNVHASLLPAYRGAAPIARCIMDGCEKTGVTIMKTELGLDTGDILMQRETPIEKTDTADTLTQKLSEIGAELITEALGQIEKGTYTLTPQGEGFVCKKVNRTQVDFSESARKVSATIRALSSSPLSYGSLNGLIINFHFAEEIPYAGDEKAGTVLSADPKAGFLVKCGDNAVRISRLQSAGGKPMSDRDFLNGRKVQKGQCFDECVL